MSVDWAHFGEYKPRNILRRTMPEAATHEDAAEVSAPAVTVERMMAVLVRTLAPFDEARAAVAAAFEGVSQGRFEWSG